jgi:hypothetical protein
MSRSIGFLLSLKRKGLGQFNASIVRHVLPESSRRSELAYVNGIALDPTVCYVL